MFRFTWWVSNEVRKKRYQIKYSNVGIGITFMVLVLIFYKRYPALIGFPRCFHPTTTNQDHCLTFSVRLCLWGNVCVFVNPLTLQHGDISAFMISFLPSSNMYEDIVFNLQCFKSCNSNGNVNVLLRYHITPSWPLAHLLVAVWAHCSGWRQQVCHFKCRTKYVNVNSFVQVWFGLAECDICMYICIYKNTLQCVKFTRDRMTRPPLSISRGEKVLLMFFSLTSRASA